jgi:hypothetical protein
VKQFNEFVKTNFGLDVISFSSGSTILWAPFLKPKQKRERQDVEIALLVKSLSGTTSTDASSTKTSSGASSTIITDSIDLDVLAVDAKGDDVELPTFRYAASAAAK